MCHFVTLVARETDEGRLTDVLAKHDRVARRIANPAVAALLAPGQQQYITAKHCDCGTALGYARVEAQRREKYIASELDRQRKRLSRLGWSEAKMERWIRDREAADQRRSERRVDTIDKWDALIAELGAAGIGEVGLLLHCYSGALYEPFDCTADKVLHGANRREALGYLAEDVLTRFATTG